MASKTIFTTVHAELEAVKADLVTMETDRDELLERLNQHECAGPADVELADALEAAQSMIGAVREDFEHLSVLARGYEAQRDEARSDVQSCMERIAGLEGSAPFVETRCRLVTGSNPSEQIDCQLRPDHNGACYSGEPSTQTFAPPTVPKFQFDEAIKQRDEAREERDALEHKLQSARDAMGAIGQERDDAREHRDRLNSQCDRYMESVESLGNQLVTSRAIAREAADLAAEMERKRNQAAVEADLANAKVQELTAQRDAAYQGSEPQSQERIETLLGVCAARLAEIERLEEERDALRATRDELSRELEKAKRTIAHRESVARKRLETMRRQKEEITGYARELATAGCRVQAVAEERDDVKADLDRLLAEAVERDEAEDAGDPVMANRLADAHLDIASLNTEIGRMATDLTEMVERCDAAEGDRDDFRLQRDRVIHEKLLVVEDHEILTQRYEGIAETCDELRAECEAKVGVLNAVTKERSDCEIELRIATQMCRELTEQRDDFSDRLCASVRETDDLTTERNDLRRQRDALLEEREAERASTIHSTRERDGWRDLVQTLKREARELRRKFGAVSREMNEYKQGAQIRTVERDEARTERDAARRRTQAVEKSRRDIAEERESIRDHLRDEFEKRSIAEERLKQAIQHIDDVTAWVCGQTTGATHERLAKDIRRKYLREQVTESPENQTIAPDRQESPLEPRVVIAGPCADRGRCNCRDIVTNNPDARPPFHKDCFCYMLNDGPREPLQAVGPLAASADELANLAPGTEVRNIATRITWLAPENPCRARQDGLHVYNDSRHGPPVCGACRDEFMEEQPPTETKRPQYVRHTPDGIAAVYEDGGVQTWAPPRGTCLRPSITPHIADVSPLVDSGTAPICSGCHSTYTMDRVAYPKPGHPVIKGACFCGGDKDGHPYGTVDFCLGNVAK